MKRRKDTITIIISKNKMCSSEIWENHVSMKKCDKQFLRKKKLLF